MLEKVENLPKGKDIGDAFRERQVAMAVACVFAAKRLSVSFNSTKNGIQFFRISFYAQRQEKENVLNCQL